MFHIPMLLIWHRFLSTVSPDGIASFDCIRYRHDDDGRPLLGRTDQATRIFRLLHCESPVLMLWTAPPPARECHGYGGY
jgi:hypothetical protein